MPVDRWDRLSRRAGIVSGADQWQARLARRRAETLDRGDPDAEWLDDELAKIDRFARFVEELVARTTETFTTWSGWCAWATELVQRYIGVPPSSWPEAEIRAHERLLDRLAALGALPSTLPVDRGDVPHRAGRAARAVRGPRRAVRRRRAAVPAPIVAGHGLRHRLRRRRGGGSAAAATTGRPAASRPRASGHRRAGPRPIHRRGTRARRVPRGTRWRGRRGGPQLGARRSRRPACDAPVTVGRRDRARALRDDDQRPPARRRPARPAPRRAHPRVVRRRAAAARRRDLGRASSSSRRSTRPRSSPSPRVARRTTRSPRRTPGWRVASTPCRLAPSPASPSSTASSVPAPAC